MSGWASGCFLMFCLLYKSALLRTCCAPSSSSQNNYLHYIATHTHATATHLAIMSGVQPLTVAASTSTHMVAISRRTTASCPFGCAVQWGAVPCGAVWVVWCRVASCGVVWCGVVWCGVQLWCSVVTRLTREQCVRGIYQHHTAPLERGIY